MTNKALIRKIAVMLYPGIAQQGAFIIECEKLLGTKVEKEDYAADFAVFFKSFKGRKGKYGHIKGDKGKACDEWKGLSPQEKELAIKAAPYAVDDYTQDAFRWLRGKRWNDIVVPRPNTVEEWADRVRNRNG